MGEEPGAEILGARLEDHTLVPRRRGSRCESSETPSDGNYKQELLPRSDVLRILDIAPELEGAQEMIVDLFRAGIVPSIGHTDCDYVTAVKGFDNGPD